jgi:hypothetical protein
MQETEEPSPLVTPSSGCILQPSFIAAKHLDRCAIDYRAFAANTGRVADPQPIVHLESSFKHNDHRLHNAKRARIIPVTPGVDARSRELPCPPAEAAA